MRWAGFDCVAAINPARVFQQPASEMTSEEPLTLGEMTDFLLNAWPLIDVLEMNFDDDIESALGFFKAKSAFYSDFDHLCRKRVIEAFPVQPEDKEEAEENS
jgi:hypothetical protein